MVKTHALILLQGFELVKSRGVLSWKNVILGALGFGWTRSWLLTKLDRLLTPDLSALKCDVNRIVPARP